MSSIQLRMCLCVGVFLCPIFARPLHLSLAHLYPPELATLRRELHDAVDATIDRLQAAHRDAVVAVQRNLVPVDVILLLPHLF